MVVNKQNSNLKSQFWFRERLWFLCVESCILYPVDIWLMMTVLCASYGEGYMWVQSWAEWRASPDRAGSRRRCPPSGGVQRAGRRTVSPAAPCPPSSGAAAADVCSAAAAHSVRQRTTAASETAAPSRLHTNTALHHQQIRADENERLGLGDVWPWTTKPVTIAQVYFSFMPKIIRICK